MNSFEQDGVGWYRESHNKRKFKSREDLKGMMFKFLEISSKRVWGLG